VYSIYCFVAPTILTQFAETHFLFVLKVFMISIQHYWLEMYIF